MLIGICGKMGSGKDTLFLSLLRQSYWYRYAFADKLKEICTGLFRLKKRSEREREILQKVGAFMRSLDKDVWVTYLMDYITRQMRLAPDRNLCITDVRYPNEAEAVLNAGGIIFVLDADQATRKLRIQLRDGMEISDSVWKEMQTHESETMVDVICEMNDVYVIDANQTKEKVCSNVSAILFPEKK